MFMYTASAFVSMLQNLKLCSRVLECSCLNRRPQGRFRRRVVCVVGAMTEMN